MFKCTTNIVDRLKFHKSPLAIVYSQLKTIRNPDTFRNLLLERIVVQSTLLVVFRFFAALRNCHHALHFGAIGGRQHFGAQRALNVGGRIDFENVTAHNVDVASVLLVHGLDERGGRIELHHKVAARLVDETVFADFVWQRTCAEILQLTDDAAVVENLVGGALQGGNNVGLRTRGVLRLNG